MASMRLPIDTPQWRAVIRVRAELMMGRGVLVGHNAVAMLMHRAGLKGLPGNKRARSRHEAVIQATNVQFGTSAGHDATITGTWSATAKYGATSYTAGPTGRLEVHVA